VVRANGTLWRVEHPSLWVRREGNFGWVRYRCRNSAASCRRARPSWPFHPDPSAGFRL